MEARRLSLGESRFLAIIWEREPVTSGELVQLCAERLGWKKSTTYTRLKILVEKGYVQNVDSRVTSRIPREEVLARESNLVVEQTFDGSLPSFLVAFLGERKLSPQEAQKISEIIEAHREDDT